MRQEREDLREWDFTHPCNQRVKCGPVCGCQSGKTSGESRPRARLSFSARSQKGTTRGGLGRGAHPVVVDLPSRVSAPECKTSAEKERTSRAVRQEKGNLLEGKERVTGS